MNQKPKVAIVILNWNGIEHLRQFLPSVMASTWSNLSVVVGDNGSTDGSIDFLEKNYPQITCIINDRNYGFTGGYNKVLSHVAADYYILLNSDVEVGPEWIEPVIALMESDPLIAAAAPKIKSFANKNQFEHAGAAGGFIDSFGYPFCRGRMFYEIEDDHGQYDESGEVFWATGAALFIKKKCWDEACGFDDRFFAHMEEIDLCWRLKNMGYQIMYCASSTVYHVGGGTLNTENPFKTYLNFRNNLLLLKNNLPFWRAFFVITIRFWMDLLALFRFLNEGKRKDAWAVSRAHRNFLLQLFKRQPRNRQPTGINAAQGQPSAFSSHFSPKNSHHSQLRCMFKGSVVAAFFLKKMHRFSDLDQADFY
jgi:GT2 family glycosyltransferase